MKEFRSVCERKILQVNVSNVKVMRCTREGEILEYVEKVLYLGLGIDARERKKEREREKKKKRKERKRNEKSSLYIAKI